MWSFIQCLYVILGQVLGYWRGCFPHGCRLLTQLREDSYSLVLGCDCAVRGTRIVNISYVPRLKSMTRAGCSQSGRLLYSIIDLLCVWVIWQIVKDSLQVRAFDLARELLIFSSLALTVLFALLVEFLLEIIAVARFVIFTQISFRCTFAWLDSLAHYADYSSWVFIERAQNFGTGLVECLLLVFLEWIDDRNVS